MMITSFHHSSNFIFLYRMFRWLTHLFCNIQRKIFFYACCFYVFITMKMFCPSCLLLQRFSRSHFDVFSLHLLNFLNIYSACVFAYEVMSHGEKKRGQLVYLSFLNSSIMFFSLKKEAFIWKLVILRVELFVSYHLVCKRIILIHPDLYCIQSNSY